MSFRQFVLHLSSQASWVWVILTPIKSESRSDMMVGTHFPRVITLVFIWPGKVMSCLAHLAGGLIVIVSILARLTILPSGNCKTYSISCSWWILCVSKVRPLIETPYHCYLKAWLWYPAHQQEHWRRDTKCFFGQLSKHHCMGNILINPCPLSEWLGTCSPILHSMFCLYMGRIYS